VESVRERDVPLAPPPTGSVLRSAAPRLLRDGFGPLATFYAGWKLIGLAAGIGLAVLYGLAVFLHERRQGRPAMIVRVALFLVLIRAGIGLTAGSARVYLAQEIATDTLIAGIVFGLLAKGRPLAAVFAREIYPLPEELSESRTFADAMARITAVWGIYFLVRAFVRLTALLTLSTDQYVYVSAASEAPFLVLILAWSVRYTANAFRTSPQWGPLLAAAETAPARSPSGL
jgi:hypothetical protein